MNESRSGLRRFILTLWFERRDKRGDERLWRGSLVELVPGADPGTPPRVTYFQHIANIAQTLRRMLERPS